MRDVNSCLTFVEKVVYKKGHYLKLMLNEGAIVQTHVEEYNIIIVFDQGLSSMEIQTHFSSKALPSAPVPPLQGYFRFRHQMMKNMPDAQRTSEEMLRLWNELSSEQKAAQDREIEVQMKQYHDKLTIWRNSQKIPQRSLENTTFFKVNTERQNSAEETKPEVTQNHSQTSQTPINKTKPIGKEKSKRTTKPKAKPKKV